MLWTTKLFGVKKPIIAMLHLDPLPGDPRWRYGDTMESVVQHALADLKALQDGGVDGILISNEFTPERFHFYRSGFIFYGRFHFSAHGFILLDCGFKINIMITSKRRLRLACRCR